MSAKLDRMLGRRPMRTLIGTLKDNDGKVIFERLFDSRWKDDDRNTGEVVARHVFLPAHNAGAIGDEFECTVSLEEATPEDIARLTGPWGRRETVERLKAA